MVDTTEIKESLQREVEALVKARDDLKQQIRLAKEEAKDELSRIEETFERFQGEIRRIGADAKEPLRDIGSAARGLVDELKRGYSRIKSQVKDAAD
jgi:ferritin-like metal-binding protein YciE